VNATFYDITMYLAERFGLRETRRKLLADLRGVVVDVGADTGANFRFSAGISADSSCVT
jgi:hypothetical protein